MTKDSVKKYTLYRWRFWIGYSFLAILVLSILTFATLYVPGGLSDAEQASVMKSVSLRLDDPSSLFMTDLPYHAVQQTSVHVLGLSSFSAKLPSLILGFASAIALVLVLRRRFTQSTSIITAGIIVVSSLFISLATTATPAIMAVFWPVTLLAVAVHSIQRHRIAPGAIYATGVIAALSLLTPFSLYMLLAFTIGCLLHPHARYLLRKTSSAALATAGILVATVLGGIAYASITQPEIMQALLYKSDSFSLDIVHNLSLIAMQIVDFSSASTATTGMLAPVFGLSSLVFVVLGLYQMFKWRHAALSYVTFTWLTFIAVIIVLNPSAVYLLVVPFALLMASGVSSIFRYWYRLFPYNPYARIFALVPVTILFACIILSSTVQYFYAFHYYAPLANRSTDDFELVTTELRREPDATLMVSNGQEAFYRLYLDSNNFDNPLIAPDPASLEIIEPRSQGTTIATRDIAAMISDTPAYIVADTALHRPSDRLYVYKSNDK